VAWKEAAVANDHAQRHLPAHSVFPYPIVLFDLMKKEYLSG
jgi:hypothetical protein